MVESLDDISRSPDAELRINSPERQHMSISEFPINQSVVGSASPDAVRVLARHFARIADQMAASNEVAEVEVMLGRTSTGALVDIQLRVPLLIG